MKAFTKPLFDLAGFDEMTKTAENNKGLISVTGCIDAQKPQMIYAFGGDKKNKLIVTFHEQKAKELYEEYSFFDREVVYYPAKDMLFYQSDIRGNLLTAERIKALKAIRENEHVTLVTTFDALMNTMAPLESMWDSVLSLESGQTADMEELTAALVRMGYEKEYQVETIGQFSVRGGILDIFPLTEENPIRIEFWGDEIDTIRYFDCESQKSIESVDEISIYPASEIVLTDEKKSEGIKKMLDEAERVSEKLRKDMKTEEAYRVSSTAKELAEEWGELSMYAGMDAFLSYFFDEKVGLLDYFDKDNTFIFFDELTRCFEQGKLTETEVSESMKHRLASGYVLPGQMDELFLHKQIAAKLDQFSCISLAALDTKSNGIKLNGQYAIHCQSVSAYNNSFELLIKDLKRYRKNGYRVILLSGSKTRAERLAQDITDEGLPCFFTEDYDHELCEGQIMVCFGKVRRGFEYPILKFAVITESDIFGAEKKRKKKKHRTYEGEKIQSFTDLAVGDYVVHENHGLGIYKGIEKIEVDRKVKDYIKIEYQGGSNLYILATQLDQIQKYAGRDARKPKLNKLGGQEWTKTKNRVRVAVKEIAADLVKLYAQREEQNGYAYGPDTIWQREFEELFPFEETEDQIMAIDATKQDMQSHKIMDRLICGDVGYGKTEIAIRAAFKAVQEGKQVAYLAPTTILAQQIYNTFSQRMKDFPVNVDLMCRFRTAAEQKKTIENLKKGQVDIVVGTHRILSKDVVFKDLGLLVIDEEQRFGVAQKEKLREMTTNVDTLMLSATPIPRTLNMAMSGISDISVLDEAPGDRRPVQTYVMEHDDGMITDAICRELDRHGQVLYLYNKIENIEFVADRIQTAIPHARVTFAHGRMEKEELEDIWQELVRGEIDVLVCTTIIETGVDLPNANTLIIENADSFGLSQLHEIRGRVGRSERQAYAYLTYRPGKALSEVAEKRLETIREFAEFGAGFKIALRDMEIRGVGNLLGPEQHGYIESVGYDLYVKLLNEAILEEKGEAIPERFEATVAISLSAHIPETYIPSAATRMEMYKKIAFVETSGDRLDLLDEFADSFGDPPKAVVRLVDVALIKAVLEKAKIRKVEAKDGALNFYMDKPRLDIWAEVFAEIPLMSMIGANTPYVHYKLCRGEEATAAAIRILTKYCEAQTAIDTDTPDASGDE